MGTNNSLKKDLFSSLRWQTIFNLVTKLIVPITYIILARYLEPEDFGLLAIVMLVNGLAQILMEMGLNAAIVQRKDLEEIHLSTAFLMNIISGIGLIIIIYYGASIIEFFLNMPGLSIYLQVFSIIFIINAFGSVQESILIRKLMFKKISLIKIISSILNSATTIILAVLGFRLWSIVIGTIVFSLSSSVLFWFTGEWKPSTFKFEKDKFWELFSFGSGVFLNRVIGRISNLDTIIIGKLLGDYSLGIYSYSYQISSTVPQTLVGTISSVLFPALSNVQENRQQVKYIYFKAIKYLSIVGVPATIGFIFVVPEFVTIFLTEKWNDSILIMQILALFFMTNVIGGGLWGSTLYALGKSYEALKLTIIRLLGLGIFVLVGIYLYGFLGAVIGLTTYGYVFRFLYQHIINKMMHATMLEYFKCLFPSIICVLFMSIVLIIYIVMFLSTMSIYFNFCFMITLGIISYSTFLKLIFQTEFNQLLEIIRERD
jgi:PST family polysaccharide transporter